MEVTVMSATQNPIDVISLAAGTSYNKDNVSLARIKSCVKHEHTSVLEHASITFKIEGVSRVLTHQLVRHRLASFVQESQRYCKYTNLVDRDDWYVIPDKIAEDEKLVDDFKYAMQHSASIYEHLLDNGVKAEDARYVLPNAAKTTVTMTMNAREFFSLLNLRLSAHAQKEIRDLAQMMREAAANESEQWAQLMDIYTENQHIIN